MQHKKKERSEPGGAPAFVGPPGAAYPPGPPAPGGNYVYLTTPGGIPQAIPANGGVAPSQAGAPPAPEIMSPQQQALQHQLAQLQQQQRQVQEQQRQVQEQQRQHQLQQQQQQLLAQAQAHAQAQQQVQQQQQKQQQAQLQAQQSSSQGGSKADGAGDPLYSRSSPDNSSPPDGGNLLANQVQGDMLADALSSLHFNGKDEPSTDAERANSPLGGGGLEVGIGFSSAIGGSDNLFSEFLGGAGGSGGGGGGGDDGSGGGGGGGNGANAGDSTSTPLETAAAALAAVTSSGSNTTIDSMGGYSSSAISTAGGQPFGPGVVSRAQSDTSGYSTEVGSGLFAHPNGVGTAIGTPAAAAAAAASDGAPAAGAMSTDAQIEALQRQLQQQSALLQGQSELLRNLLNTQTQVSKSCGCAFLRVLARKQTGRPSPPATPRTHPFYPPRTVHNPPRTVHNPPKRPDHCRPRKPSRPRSRRSRRRRTASASNKQLPTMLITINDSRRAYFHFRRAWRGAKGVLAAPASETHYSTWPLDPSSGLCVCDLPQPPPARLQAPAYVRRKAHFSPCILHFSLRECRR